MEQRTRDRKLTQKKSLTKKRQLPDNQAGETASTAAKGSASATSTFVSEVQFPKLGSSATTAPTTTTRVLVNEKPVTVTEPMVQAPLVMDTDLDTPQTEPWSATNNPILQLIQNDPMFRSGYLYQSNGEFEAAAECYARSIQRKPSPEAFCQLGFVLSQLGDLDGAIFHARKALELNSVHSQAWLDLGTYLIEKLAFDEALDCLKKALEGKTYFHRASAHYQLARAYMCKGMLIAAEQCLDQCLHIEPDFAPAKSMYEQIKRALH